MTFLSDDDLPICFTKEALLLKYGGNVLTLNSQIHRALKERKLLHLKNGLYMMASSYLDDLDKTKLTEYTASRLYVPSYISLEYVLEKYHLLPHDHDANFITSITTKTNRTYKNFSGEYRYSSVKPSIYFGYDEVTFRGGAYFIATKAKALFDYFYLRSDLHCRNEKHLQRQLFEESDIQWQNFSEGDFARFDRYVWGSNSFKMMTVRRIIERHFDEKKFDRWAKELLK